MRWMTLILRWVSAEWNCIILTLHVLLYWWYTMKICTIDTMIDDIRVCATLNDTHYALIYNKGVKFSTSEMSHVISWEDTFNFSWSGWPGSLNHIERRQPLPDSVINFRLFPYKCLLSTLPLLPPSPPPCRKTGANLISSDYSIYAILQY
jgi:hypothetical protein